MPLYTIKCLSCGQEIEALLKVTDDPIKELDVECGCGNSLFTNMLGTPRFNLNGDGFYNKGDYQ